MVNFRDVILDPLGEPVNGATVSVYLYNTMVPVQIFDKAGNLMANPLATNALGEVEFWARNGKYTLGVRHPAFNEGNDKYVDIHLYDPAEVSVEDTLRDVILDSNGLILMSRLPFRVYVVDTQADLASMQGAAKDDIGVIRGTGRKWIRTEGAYTGTIGDWFPLDVVTSVAGKTGDVTLFSADISDLSARLRLGANEPNGPAYVGTDGKIPVELLPANANIARLVDEDTSLVYRLVVVGGELALRPVIQ